MSSCSLKLLKRSEDSSEIYSSSQTPAAMEQRISDRYSQKILIAKYKRAVT